MRKPQCEAHVPSQRHTYGNSSSGHCVCMAELLVILIPSLDFSVFQKFTHEHTIISFVTRKKLYPYTFFFQRRASLSEVIQRWMQTNLEDSISRGRGALQGKLKSLTGTTPCQ